MCRSSLVSLSFKFAMTAVLPTLALNVLTAESSDLSLDSKQLSDTEIGFLGRVTMGLKRDSHGATSLQPRQHLYAPLLGAAPSAMQELWHSSKPVQLAQWAGVTYRHDGDILIGVIEIDETELLKDASLTPLQQASEQAYRKLFEVLDHAGYHHLWRAWNYMANINGVSEGLERYRQFNLGRQQGFMHSKRSVTGNVPAACAIGVSHGPLSVMFLAGHEPTEPFENPRQVAAYDYPAEYGPRSPTFSRASLATLRDQELLMLSGTASIVGHQTLHKDDVRQQTFETLSNIEAVIQVANLRRKATRAYSLDDFSLRIYVRHQHDFPLVHQLLSERLGAAHRPQYLQADICRADLAVEIEGLASQRLVTS
jgi:chorismate lyase / 3-hydroxybenzoate synthase